MKWYYADNNERRGPVEDPEFQALIAAGKIQPDTLVWRDGMANWQPSREVAAELPTTPPAASAGSLAVAPAPVAGGEVCSQCQQPFPPDEMIRYEGRFVCAGCKPLFFQRLKEGALPAGEHEYAGFWIRFGAKFIDGLIMQIVSVILNLGLAFSGLQQDVLIWASTGISLVVNAAYAIYFIGRFGATPGKMACKLKVIRPDGSPLSFGRATGRYFAELVSAMTLMIGYLMAAFDEQKRALHDRIADTRVVRAR